MFCFSEIVQDPWVKAGATCFVSVRADLLLVYIEARAAEERMEVTRSKFYFINCNLLAVMVWTKWGRRSQDWPSSPTPIKFCTASSQQALAVHRNYKAQLNS